MIVQRNTSYIFIKQNFPLICIQKLVHENPHKKELSIHSPPFPKMWIREVGKFNSGSKFREMKVLLYFPKLNSEFILAFLNIFYLISVYRSRVIYYSPFTSEIYLPNSDFRESEEKILIFKKIKCWYAIDDDRC